MHRHARGLPVGFAQVYHRAGRRPGPAAQLILHNITASTHATPHQPHPEEHRVAMRLEGWNESVPGSILRDGRARARPPQDEVVGIPERALKTKTARAAAPR